MKVRFFSFKMDSFTTREICNELLKKVSLKFSFYMQFYIYYCILTLAWLKAIQFQKWHRTWNWIALRREVIKDSHQVRHVLWYYISICFIVNRKDEGLWQQQYSALKMGKIKIGASGRWRLLVVDRNILHFYHILLSFFLSSRNSWHKIRHIIFFEMSFNILNSLLVLSHLTLNVKRDDDGKLRNAIQILTRHFWISRHVFGEEGLFF